MNTDPAGFRWGAALPILGNGRTEFPVSPNYSRSPGPHTSQFDCVFLTGSEEQWRLASRLLRPAGIEVHHAALLDQADSLLTTTNSSVLLTDTVFLDGTWEDANKALAGGHPRVALVVAAELADERFWIDVLEQGAFDLVVKPFLAGELRRILENANAHVQCGAPIQYCRAAGRS